jgi:hypothetical protein
MKWFSSEKDLARRLRLPHHLRVIFDLRAIPLTSHSEYNLPRFYDPTTSKESSLLEELPHLEATTKSKEIRTDYIEKISDIMVNVPFDYFQEIMQDISRKISGAGKIIDKREVVQKFYKEQFGFIIEQLMDCLELRTPEKRDLLSEKFQKSMIPFLLDML